MGARHCTKQKNWENNVLQEMIAKNIFSEMEGKEETEKVLYFMTESMMPSAPPKDAKTHTKLILQQSIHIQEKIMN